MRTTILLQILCIIFGCAWTIQTQPPYTHRLTMFFDFHADEAPETQDDIYIITKECMSALHQNASIVITDTTLWKYALMRYHRYIAMTQPSNHVQSYMDELPREVQITPTDDLIRSYHDIDHMFSPTDIDENTFNNIPQFIKYDAHCALVIRHLASYSVFLFENVMVFIPHAYYASCVKTIYNDNMLQTWVHNLVNTNNNSMSVLTHINNDSPTQFYDTSHPKERPLTTKELMTGIKLGNGTHIPWDRLFSIEHFDEIQEHNTNANIPWHTMFVNRKDLELLDVSTETPHDHTPYTQQDDTIDWREFSVPRYDIVISGHGEKNNVRLASDGIELAQRYMKNHLPSIDNTEHNALHNTIVKEWHDDAAFLYSRGASQEPEICGLEWDQAYAMLSFCNTSINTRCLYMIGCYTGGSNLDIFLNQPTQAYNDTVRYTNFTNIGYVIVTSPGDNQNETPADINRHEITHTPAQPHVKKSLMMPSPQEIRPQLDFNTFFKRINAYIQNLDNTQFDDCIHSTITLALRAQVPLVKKHNQEYFQNLSEKMCSAPSAISELDIPRKHNSGGIMLTHGYYTDLSPGDEPARPFNDYLAINDANAWSDGTPIENVCAITTLPGISAYHITCLKIPENWNSFILHDFIDMFKYQNPKFPQYIHIDMIRSPQYAIDEGKETYPLQNVLIALCDQLYFLRSSHKPVHGIYAQTPQGENFVAIQDTSHPHNNHTRSEREKFIAKQAIRNLQHDIISTGHDDTQLEKLPFGFKRLHYEKQRNRELQYMASNLPLRAARNR